MYPDYRIPFSYSQIANSDRRIFYKAMFYVWMFYNEYVSMIKYVGGGYLDGWAGWHSVYRKLMFRSTVSTSWIEFKVIHLSYFPTPDVEDKKYSALLWLASAGLVTEEHLH